jgi:iron complex outermembrane receptor protein
MPDLDMNLRLSYNYLDQDAHLVIFPPGAVLPIGTDGNIDFARPAGMTLFTDGFIGIPGASQHGNTIDLTFGYSGFENHFLRFGGGYEYTALDPRERKNFGPGVLDVQPLPPVKDGTLTDVSNTQYIYMKDEDRTIWHLLLQDEWTFTENWELTAGVRYDEYSDFGSTVNPRLALVWDTHHDLTTKLLYGRAFHAPTFGALYFINNPLSLGNENLEPETIDTLELAFNYQPAPTLYTTLSLFAYQIDDLIEYAQDPGQTTKTAQNAQDQEGKGFEIEADWLITETLNSYANFSYQHSEDEDSGETIPFAPEMVFYANLHWRFLPEWSLDGQYYWMAGRKRAAGDAREDIKDNDIVNLTLRRKNIFKNWELALAVRNLFDEDVREPSTPVIPNDYPMEERSFWAELRFTY